MKINLELIKYARHYQTSIELDGTNDLANPVIFNAIDGFESIAGAVLEFLLQTDRIELVVNGKAVEPKEDDDYESFISGESLGDYLK